MKTLKFIPLLSLVFILQACTFIPDTLESSKDPLETTTSEITISADDYNALKDDFDSLSADYQELLADFNENTLNSSSTASEETVDVKLSGGFTATVRGFMPDYVYSDDNSNIVILTLFQDTPFLISKYNFADVNLSEELEIGETYYFQFEDSYLSGITLSEVSDNSYMSPTEAIENYGVTIEGFRAPTEDEQGLNSVQIFFEVDEK